MTLLNKKSKNHFLGLRQIASNAKASLYIDSELDSIPCEIGPEEISEIVSGNYVLPDSIGNMVKHGSLFRRQDDIITPGSIFTNEFSRAVLGFILDFNLVFEYHNDTQVSDILSLFDPSIKNLVKFYAVEDPLISACQSEETLSSAVQTQALLKEKGFGRKFIEKHKIYRKLTLQNTTDYHSYQFISFIKFPNVNYLKKYNQYYIRTTSVDYHGLQFLLGSFPLTTSYRNHDSYFDFGIDAITDITFFKDNIYLNMNSSSTYAESTHMDIYRALINLMIKNSNYITYKDAPSNSIGDIENLKFDYKVSVTVNNCPSLLIKILNENKHVLSSGFNPRGAYAIKNIQKNSYSINDLVTTCFTVNLNKRTVALGVNRKNSTKLNLLESISKTGSESFKDIYNLTDLKLPMISCVDRSVVNSWFSSYVYNHNSPEIISNLINFYDKLCAGTFNNNYLTFDVISGHQSIINRLNTVSSLGFPYYDLPTYILDVCSVSIFTKTDLRKKLHKISKNIAFRHAQSTLGTQTVLLYGKKGVPETIKGIQRANIDRIIKNSTKGQEVLQVIQNTAKLTGSTGTEDLEVINLKYGLGAEFTLDSNYYNAIGTKDLDFREDKVVFNGPGDIFDQAFKAAFYGHDEFPGIVNIFRIPESLLKHPDDDLIKLFMGVVSSVSTLILRLFLYPNLTQPRAYYGATNGYLEMAVNLQNTIEHTKIPAREFKNLGEYLSSSKCLDTPEIFSSILGSCEKGNVFSKVDATSIDKSNGFSPFGRDKYTIAISDLNTFLMENICFSTATFYKLGLNTKAKRELPAKFSTAMLGNKLWLDAIHLLLISKK